MKEFAVIVELRDTERLLERIGVEASCREQIMAEIRGLWELDSATWDVIVPHNGTHTNLNIAVLKETPAECTLIFRGDEKMLDNIKALCRERRP